MENDVFVSLSSLHLLFPFPSSSAPPFSSPLSSLLRCSSQISTPLMVSPSAAFPVPTLLLFGSTTAACAIAVGAAFTLSGSASPSPLLLLLPLPALPLGGRRAQQWQLHSRPGQMGHWRWGRPLLAAAGNVAVTAASSGAVPFHCCGGCLFNLLSTSLIGSPITAL